jgi:hypothetical protein
VEARSADSDGLNRSCRALIVVGVAIGLTGLSERRIHAHELGGGGVVEAVDYVSGSQTPWIMRSSRWLEGATPANARCRILGESAL